MLDIAEGSERAFLFGAAMNVAADSRRSRARAREVHDDEALRLAVDPGSSPEELLARRRARRTLDAVLDAMSIDLRAVFVLVELEELTAPEVASLLDIPIGTVASRLRRARQEFHGIAERMRANGARLGPVERPGDRPRGEGR
jgi:RNA polymerase sigma-70 factor (ECF subfamily)